MQGTDLFGLGAKNRTYTQTICLIRGLIPEVRR